MSFWRRSGRGLEAARCEPISHWLDAQRGGHGVRRARSEFNCRAENVAGLNAEHLPPFIVAEIGEGGCTLLPRVPDDGRLRVLLGGADGAAQHGIDELRRGLRIEVGIVHGAGEANVTLLDLLAIGIGVIEKCDAVESAHSRAFYLPDAEVGMESFFELARRCSGVGRGQLQTKNLTDRDAMDETKVIWPPLARR